VTMHLAQAQKLVFADNSRVSSLIIQLEKSEMIEETQAYLSQYLKGKSSNQVFEVKNYGEFNAEFFQVVGMFIVIFIFIALMISLVVLFTTVNTLTMSVMERISEIGSLRAMGLRRSAVRWQFLLEGAVIGVAGATLGVIISIIITLLFNQSGFSWSPPGSVESRDLKILLFANPYLLIGTWLLMTLVATVSSLLPARYASKMNIVNAIRNN
ncbi:MAG TPA: ABC transporter permease, partial [Leucothrix sp.]|nr:ABC transporter permease [Leucothrix sp.]